MDTSNTYPTKHLLEKLKHRDVSWGEVIHTLERPDVSFGPDSRGRMTYQRDELCVVVGSNGAVITVLLRNPDEWTDEDARNRRATDV